MHIKIVSGLFLMVFYTAYGYKYRQENIFNQRPNQDQIFESKEVGEANRMLVPSGFKWIRREELVAENIDDDKNLPQNDDFYKLQEDIDYSDSPEIDISQKTPEFLQMTDYIDLDLGEHQFPDRSDSYEIFKLRSSKDNEAKDRARFNEEPFRLYDNQQIGHREQNFERENLKSDIHDRYSYRNKNSRQLNNFQIPSTDKQELPLNKQKIPLEFQVYTPGSNQRDLPNFEKLFEYGNGKQMLRITRQEDEQESYGAKIFDDEFVNENSDCELFKISETDYENCQIKLGLNVEKQIRYTENQRDSYEDPSVENENNTRELRRAKSESNKQKNGRAQWQVELTPKVAHYTIAFEDGNGGSSNVRYYQTSEW